jgi:hypothetical protein
MASTSVIAVVPTIILSPAYLARKVCRSVVCLI